MSNWVHTGISAEVYEGKVCIKHNGCWSSMSCPVAIVRDMLIVREDFWIDEEHFRATYIKGYYDDAGKTHWVTTEYEGTKMGNTVFAWSNGEWHPVNGPAWVNPNDNLIRVPYGVNINEIINFTS